MFAKTIATFLPEDPLFASAGTVTTTLLASVASLEAALVAVARGEALCVARAYMQTLANALPALVVKPGRTSGTARAYAKASTTRASYEWRVSLEGEPGPPVSLPGSVRADATLSGLLPGALYLVEMRTVTTDGTSEWSEPFRFRAE